MKRCPHALSKRDADWLSSDVDPTHILPTYCAVKIAKCASRLWLPFAPPLVLTSTRSGPTCVVCLKFSRFKDYLRDGLSLLLIVNLQHDLTLT